jgi:signal transduction histidine kinase
LPAFAAVEQLDGTNRKVLNRVAQEAFSNAARHAQASLVKVTIETADCIRMTGTTAGPLGWKA